jgi:SNF2 family DNA or RNA helicase
LIDEAHRLKNRQSHAHEILVGMRIEHKFIATGSPLLNSVDELFSLLNFMNPVRFGDADVFLTDFGALHDSADMGRLQVLI